MVPGDIAAAILGDDATPEAVAKLHNELGLNRPLVIQYVSWLWDLVRLDLGSSLLYRGIEVGTLIREAIPITITMTIYGMIITIIIAVPVGVVTGLREGSWMEYAFQSFSIAGVSVPTFWLGVILLFLMLKLFHWSPNFRYVSFFDAPWENFKAFILPAIVYGYYNVAVMARMLRSQILGVLREDYVRTAHAKGLATSYVIYRHALPNALLPVVTVAGNQFAAMMGGLIVTEKIFALPGLGTLTITSAVNLDYVMAQSLFFIIIIMVLIVNLGVDLIYAIIDPRIQFD
jgi:peptide/nickel transport system permease protein